MCESRDCKKPTFDAFVDGFNLYKGVLERRPQYKWLDLRKFAAGMWTDHCLRDVYYFTAPVMKRFASDTAPERQEKYLRVLRNQGIHVVRGKFRRDEKWLRLKSITRPEVIEPELPSRFGFVQSALNTSSLRALPDVPKAHVWSFGEKGSDVNLASYLLRSILSNKLNSALVVTGDSDLTTPIHFCVEAGANVRVVIPNKQLGNAALRQAATTWFELHPSTLENFQLPRSFITPKGGNIVRPQEWS
ncbi:NYN domain-containing protein [Aurantimicrobium minutum]|uniref:NYN domain-containing protein n=1 Tax=Aurantimicrobium minutum TaxID=708131 RepID=UPI002475583B|nr:NYN domain-containing protein [Aurantimicrobium minutum]MDH6238669.1 hypothetical protein [Aurantimicrobium minutum]